VVAVPEALEVERFAFARLERLQLTDALGVLVAGEREVGGIAGRSCRLGQLAGPRGKGGGYEGAGGQLAGGGALAPCLARRDGRQPVEAALVEIYMSGRPSSVDHAVWHASSIVAVGACTRWVMVARRRSPCSA
jgi:hypothetical protein